MFLFALRSLSLLAAIVFSFPGHGAAQSAAGLGILQLQTAGEDKVPVVVWYPSTAPTIDWTAGPYIVHATRGAPVSAGRHPFVLLSHGSGGSELGHADLAEALARHGYIVAAPRHLGDSYDRPEGRGTEVQIVNRPRQAKATLDAVLADPRLAGAIDPARIGMAGFSAGGYTTLVMAGARPNAGLYVAYCDAHADDLELCPASQSARGLAARTEWNTFADKRVRAAVVMAPFSVFFDAKGLADVAIPMRVYKAADDHVLRNAWNADNVVQNLPRRPETATVPGGHYVFLAPCSAALKAAVPVICVDASDVDRLAEHTRMNGEIVTFFDRNL